MSPEVVARLHQAVRAALACGAGADPGWSWPPEEGRDGPVSAGEFLRAVRGHKVAGLLAPHVEALGLPDELAESIRQQARRVVLRSLEQAGWMHVVHDRLEAAGIPVLFLKGLAVEAQTHRALGDRGGGDVDVWVPRECVAQSLSVLRPEWALPEGYPSPGAGWAWRHWLRWGTEIPLDGPVLVDLHWGLHGVRGTLPDFDAAWAAHGTVSVGGRSVPTLSPAHALNHACRHAETDRWRFLHSLVDVHLLARQVGQTGGRPSDPTLQVVDRSIGLPRPSSVVPVPEGRWEEACEEQRHLGSHRARTRSLSRPAYLRRVSRRFTATGRPSPRDLARLLWLVVLPPPWSLGHIRTTSTVRGLVQAMWSRVRSESVGAVERRRPGGRVDHG